MRIYILIKKTTSFFCWKSCRKNIGINASFTYNNVIMLELIDIIVVNLNIQYFRVVFFARIIILQHKYKNSHDARIIAILKYIE